MQILIKIGYESFIVPYTEEFLEMVKTIQGVDAHFSYNGAVESVVKNDKKFLVCIVDDYEIKASTPNVVNIKRDAIKRLEKEIEELETTTTEI